MADRIAVVTLENGPMACAIAPRLGGAIVALTHAGEPVLRHAGGLDDVLDTACFPLLPFANRIARGSFTFEGRTIALAIDRQGFPHALHGHGWRRAWTLDACSRHLAVLSLDVPASDWPWPYRAWQRLELTPDSLLVDLTIENRHASTAMPAGLGLHPYFPRASTSRIIASASAVWQNDGTGLASNLEQSTVFKGRQVAVDTLENRDNFFVSADPCVSIVDAAKTVTMRAEGAGFHVYCPPGEAWFCVEPVSHAPNSFGRGEFALGDIVGPLARRTQRFSFTVRRTV